MTDSRFDEAQGMETPAALDQRTAVSQGVSPWRVWGALLGVFLLLLCYDAARFQRLLQETALDWRAPATGALAPLWQAAQPEAQHLLAAVTEAWSWVEAARRVTGLAHVVEGEQAVSRVVADALKLDLTGRRPGAGERVEALTVRASGQPDRAQPSGNTYLLVGDSMMLSPLGSAMGERLVERFGGRYVRKGVVGTGLSRPDVYDWPGQLAKLLTLHRPDMLVVLMGANDVHASRGAGGKLHAFGGDAFLDSYRANVRAFLALAGQQGVQVFWLEIPLTENRSLNDKLARVNALQREVASEFPNVAYVQTRDLLADDAGGPRPYLRLEGNRSVHPWATDGIHLTAAASQYMAGHVLGHIVAAWDSARSERAGEPEGQVSTQQPGEIHCYRYVSVALGGEQETCVAGGGAAPGVGALLLIHPSGAAGTGIADVAAAAANRLGMAVILQSELHPRGEDGRLRPWTDRRGLTRQVLGEIQRAAEKAGKVGPIDGLAVIASKGAGGGGPSLLAKENIACMSLLQVPGDGRDGGGRSLPRLHPSENGGRLILVPDGVAADPTALRQATRQDGPEGAVRIGYPSAARWQAQVPRLMAWHRLCQRLHDHAWPGTGNDGGVALFEAIDAGLPDIVEALLARGVSPEVRDARGNTALLRAVSARQAALVPLLLNRGAKSDARDDDGWSALALAVQRGNAQLAGALLAAKVPVDSRDREGRTPLMVAAWKGSVALVDLLASAQAVIDAKDRSGETALHKAAKYNQTGTATRLLALGAAIDAPDDARKTPLMYAGFNSRTAVTRLLVTRGAQLEARDREGWTPLIETARGGSTACLRVLVEHGAKAAAVTDDQRTALIVAAREGHGAAVAYLAGLPGDLDQRDRSGNAALHYAARNGHRGVVATLLKAGASADLPDGRGGTALLLAVRQSDGDLVRRLLQAGADPLRSNAAGESPLSLARSQGDAAIVALLTAPESRTPEAATARPAVPAVR